MEKDQLLDMIRLYKQALADMTEEKFACQALLNMQAKQIQDLNDQIQNLLQQLQEVNGGINNGWYQGNLGCSNKTCS